MEESSPRAGISTARRTQRNSPPIPESEIAVFFAVSLFRRADDGLSGELFEIR
jgi:hypothetical protein